MIEITEKMVEDGAQALANDVWHPPVPLKSLSKLEAGRFRRLSLIVLKAALTSVQGI